MSNPGGNKPATRGALRATKKRCRVGSVGRTAGSCGSSSCEASRAGCWSRYAPLGLVVGPATTSAGLGNQPRFRRVESTSRWGALRCASEAGPRFTGTQGATQRSGARYQLTGWVGLVVFHRMISWVNAEGAGNEHTSQRRQFSFAGGQASKGPLPFPEAEGAFSFALRQLR
jgi:hypothetical protein